MELVWKMILMLLALAAAAAAAFISIAIASPLATVEPLWASEAFTGFVTAAVWMVTGMLIAPRHAAATALLFLAGTGCAWFVSRGVVHSVSPYFGLMSVAAACAGGGLAWVVVTHVTERRISPLAVALPAGALAIASVIALTTPALAVTRQLWNGDRDPMHVHMLPMDRDGRSIMYLWTETATSISLSERVLVDSDPGSGPGDYRLAQVHDATTIDAVCKGFREYTQAMIDSEIVRGSIPGFIKRIPFNLARCEEGALWETTPARTG